MYIVWTIIIGFVVGLLARAVMPGKDSAGFIVTTVLGVIGAFVAGMLGRTLGLYNEGEPAGFLMSVAGAVVALFIYKMVVDRPSIQAR